MGLDVTRYVGPVLKVRGDKSILDELPEEIEELLSEGRGENYRAGLELLKFTKDFRDYLNVKSIQHEIAWGVVDGVF